VPRSSERLSLPLLGCEWEIKHQINNEHRQAAIAETVDIRTGFHQVGGIG